MSASDLVPERAGRVDLPDWAVAMLEGREFHPRRGGPNEHDGFLDGAEPVVRGIGLRSSKEARRRAQHDCVASSCGTSSSSSMQTATSGRVGDDVSTGDREYDSDETISERDSDSEDDAEVDGERQDPIADTGTVISLTNAIIRPPRTSSPGKRALQESRDTMPPPLRPPPRNTLRW